MEISKIKIGSTLYDIRDNTSSSTSGALNKPSTKLYITGADSQSASATTYSNANCYIGIDNCLYSNGVKVLTTSDNTGDGDTKNTAGTTDYKNTKMFLVASPSQGANPQTYSNDKCYIGTDNCLYTNGTKAVNSQDVTDAINTELYNNATKPSGAYTITNQNIENILQEIGVGGSPEYANVGYAVSRINGSGSLTIPGTDPVYVVTVSLNISSVTLQNNPTYGHSCHVFFKSANNSSKTVTISNHSTNRICPDASKGVVLTIPAASAGYVEVDFLNAGNSTIGDEVYVRGI